MKLKKLIEKLEKERARFVEKHGIEPDLYDVCDGDDFSRKQIEIGQMKPHESGAKACHNHRVIKFKL